MRVLSIDHITINCSELEASFQFYEQIFLLERLDSIDMGDHTLHYYQLPTGVSLELIEYKNIQKHLTTRATDTGIYRHFAVAVDDINVFYAQCEKLGVQIKLHPTYIAPLKRTAMLIVDPNGVEIEVVCIPSS